MTENEMAQPRHDAWTSDDSIPDNARRIETLIVFGSEHYDLVCVDDACLPAGTAE